MFVDKQKVFVPYIICKTQSMLFYNKRYHACIFQNDIEWNAYKIFRQSDSDLNILMLCPVHNV